ncbi:hypothetical protein DB346_04650 [Verrucomicrobia bacterium LW23]|nr:hypothetical protein DB346_04650 [Verrucomicrobia bacterium LW23]
MGYKKTKVGKSGPAGYDFDGLVLDNEMLKAIDLKKSKIAEIVEMGNASYTGFIPFLLNYFAPAIAFLIGITLLALAITRSSRMAITFFVIASASVVAIASASWKERKKALAQYANLIDILRKIRIYNNMVDKHRAVAQLRKHGVEVTTAQSPDDVDQKLSDLRDSILRALNTDRILRDYTGRWGVDAISSPSEVLELQDLDSLCTRQVEDLQIALNVETRLIDEQRQLEG